MKVIYAIVNLTNGKRYIGSAVNFSRRRSKHLNQLKRNNHHSIRLQNSWNKNNPEDFKFIILEKIVDGRDLYKVEQEYLDKYKTYDKKNGYNICFNTTCPNCGDKKEVFQFSINGDFINKFNSCVEASESVLCDCSGLSKCARGKYRFYAGYIWSYEDHISEDRIKLASNPIKRSDESKSKMSISAKKRTDHSKPILQYNLDGSFVSEWNSTSEVVRKFGYSCGSISDTLHGKHKHAYGYIWKFKNKQDE